MTERLNTDFLDYFPIRHGLSPSQIGLRRLPTDRQDARNKIFQMGTDWQECLENKRLCRVERLGKYYQSHAARPPRAISLWIMNELAAEYPDLFALSQSPSGPSLHAKHTGDVIAASAEGDLDRTRSQLNSFAVEAVDLFDALAMQVPEDLVVQGCADDYSQDECQQVHLCHANGWSAEWAIGKSFDAIHARVPRIETIIRDTAKILRAIVESPAVMERIGAVNFRTSAQLNRHPEIPEEKRHVPFHHRDNAHLYLRFERQCTVGFAAEKAFLFTIRTYRTQLDPGMPLDAWKSFVQAMAQSSDGTNPHRFLASNRDELLRWIQSSG
ncbi:MAG TPA: heme-dependent oxidative N-demethylase subunit alpha family protein [Bdellovibrionota bacterium]|jgi:hypothetical protein|nr:heme-dependent oxidative N-demethylase subunit alpha family protein [Bdellovibrionota bacterium]